MKETGINYSYSALGLDTGTFAIFYTFEEGAGTEINSISGAQPVYSGTLSSATSFWSKPGSGYFNGATITVNNSSGADSPSWTKIFVYEKVDANNSILFDSLGGGSGHRIGITSSNKPYFESFNQQPITAASSNNYSSKNAISVSYLPNLVTIGYFNFNAQAIEAEEFAYPFQISRSDSWVIGSQYTGYMDYFIHLSAYQSPQVIAQLLSGLYAYPTGVGYSVQTVYATGITGYQTVFVGQTGITGYQTLPGGDVGTNYFTGAFPTLHTELPLTGYLSSGLYSSGVGGVAPYLITGNKTTLFEYLTGYASSFGMQKIVLLNPILSGDIVKTSYDFTPFNNIYNQNGLSNYSGYQTANSYLSGLFDIFYNGEAISTNGWSVSGNYLTVLGSTVSDIVTYDLKMGNKNLFSVTGGLTGFAFSYSGQEIYLNGLDLISGYDFVMNGAILYLTNKNTGISGYISEYPIVLNPMTGAFSIQSGFPFSRNASNVYINGLRQQLSVDYIEGSVLDLLSGNSYNPAGMVTLYDDNNLYWE